MFITSMHSPRHFLCSRLARSTRGTLECYIQLSYFKGVANLYVVADHRSGQI